MGLNYKKVVVGPYVYSEKVKDKDKDRDVLAISDNWYLQVIASMVNSGDLSTEEFNNFFEDSLKSISD